jgi:hypothetical protein
VGPAGQIFAACERIVRREKSAFVPSVMMQCDKRRKVSIQANYQIARHVILDRGGTLIHSNLVVTVSMARLMRRPDKARILRDEILIFSFHIENRRNILLKVPWI